MIQAEAETLRARAAEADRRFETVRRETLPFTAPFHLWFRLSRARAFLTAGRRAGEDVRRNFRRAAAGAGGAATAHLRAGQRRRTVAGAAGGTAPADSRMHGSLAYSTSCTVQWASTSCIMHRPMAHGRVRRPQSSASNAAAMGQQMELLKMDKMYLSR